MIITKIIKILLPLMIILIIIIQYDLIVKGTSAALAKEAVMGKAALVIQRVFRGMMGRRRLKSKRSLDKAAKEAYDFVDEKSILVGDVKELGRRILYALEEPMATSLPPDEVLHLIRLCTMMIQASRGNLGLADYTFLNDRQFDEVDGEHLTWVQAGKVVNRSERFLRQVRLLAYGPGSKPPRLVSIPSNATLLATAMAGNPRWAVSTFEHMGMGSKICCQLFKWVSSVTNVASRQQEFLSLIASSFPDWLPKLYEHQRGTRKGEMDGIVNRKCLELLSVMREESADDFTLCDVYDEEVVFIKRDLKTARSNVRENSKEVDRIKNDQSSREVFALDAMEEKIDNAKKDLDECSSNFLSVMKLANAGDKGAIDSIGEVRHKLTSQKLKLSEYEGQQKLLQIQVDKNKSKRKDPAALTPDIIQKAIVAGESKAAYYSALIKTKTMLRVAEVKHASDLPTHLVEIHEGLALKEEELKREARRLYVVVETEKKLQDDLLSKLLLANELNDMKSRDQMSPTDLELQEERFEDEKEARLEREKHRQYLPDSVLHSAPKRPRPVVIALSRDLPGNAKARMHQQITTAMPGMLITLDCGDNMGFDSVAMQTILDSQNSIIMSVDHGLTRMTRDSFLRNLEVTLAALVPKPFVILAVGDEQNKRGMTGTEFGVDKQDINLMRDKDIKICLEWMAWVTQEVQRLDLRVVWQLRAAEVIPSSKPFVLVLEALFLILSDEDIHKSPDEILYGHSWRVTRKLLIEPNELSAKMSAIRRGRSFLRQRESVAQYVKHSLWPPLYGSERSSDICLQLIAQFVESWHDSERITLEKGGAPLQAIAKSVISGIQSVVYVTDSIDPADEIDNKNGNGWKISSFKVIRAALQDIRIFKTVKKIDDVLLNISVYRENGVVYFDGYDAATSDMYMVTVTVDDIPSLLVPNGFSISKGDNDPPKVPMDMYKKLVDLLRIDTVSKKKGMKKKLVCKRQYTFLRNISTRLNGHFVHLKCYEAALGELYFVAYLPEFSANLRFLVNDVIRLNLLKSADTEETLEHNFVEADDARPLLPYVLDRLRLTPSKTFLQTNKGVFMKGTDNVDRIYLNMNKDGNFKERTQQGFTLKCRVHGGAGKIILRQVKQFNGVPHILEIRLSTPVSMLALSLYEPRSRRTMKVRISKFERKLLLGTLNDDIHSWYGQLMKRLRVNWHGICSLFLDKTVLRVVRTICRQRFIVTFSLLTEESLKVTLYESSTGCEFDCSLSKDELIKLLHIKVSVARIMDKQGNVKDDSVKKVLVLMREEAEDVKNEEDELIVSSKMNSTSFLEILAHPDNLVNVANHFRDNVAARDDKNFKSGFVLKKDDLSIKIVYKVPDVLAPLQTSLRFEQRLKQSPLLGTVEGVIRSRRQVPIILMEEELNHLALQKSLLAQQEITNISILNIDVQEHIDSIGLLSMENVITEVVNDTASAIVEKIEKQFEERETERATPGTLQTIHDAKMEELEQEQIAEQILQTELLSKINVEDSAIMGKEWKLVFEAGVKTNYRDGRVRWHGHVSVKVLEMLCWLPEGDGPGRRLKFIVYEPNEAAYYEGIIRSHKHLREVLGLHSQDLLDTKRGREMILFICKYRMDVVKNNITWDGEVNEAGAPAFRIEFQSERLYNNDKVTPINVAEVEDEEANSKKLIDIGICCYLLFFNIYYQSFTFNRKCPW